jgi:hypothetical protein
VPLDCGGAPPDTERAIPGSEPSQGFSSVSVVHDPPPLLPASLALGDGSPSRIIPRMSRAWPNSASCSGRRSDLQIRRSGHIVQGGPVAAMCWADIPGLSARIRCCPAVLMIRFASWRLW